MHNYKAVTAATGEEALAICAKQPIDLLLLDVCLPDIDGYEVCRRIKADPATNDIAVIFVTVKGSADDIKHGFSLGAVDYIAKPYNLPMVMVRVDAALRIRATADKTSSKEDSIGDTAYTDSLTGLRNRRYLLERLQEEVEKAHRYDYPVSCVVFDIEDITAVDDELGPVSMDDLLAEVAMSIRNYSRMYDVLARYDATLFAAVLPHTPLPDAVNYARKIVDEVDGTTFSDPNFPTTARLSAGIVSCQNGAARGAEFVLGEAMRGLLKAKSQDKEHITAYNL